MIRLSEFPFRLLLIAAHAAALAVTCHGGYTFSPIAATSGELWRAFPPTINAHGTVAYFWQYDGIGAIYISSGGPPVAVANTADSFTLVPATTSPAISDEGTVAFRARFGNDPSGNPAYGIFTSSGGLTTTVATQNDASQTPAFIGFRDDAPMIDASGGVAFKAVFRPNGDPNTDWEVGIFRKFGNDVTWITPEAHVVGLPAYSFLRNNHFSMNSSGTVVFQAYKRFDGDGVFTGSGGSVSTVALENSLGTGFMMGNPVINGAGTVVFSQDNIDYGHNLYTGRNNGSPAVFVSSGEGHAYGSVNIQGVSINDAGTIVFSGWADSTGSGIFSGPNPAADVVIKTGDPLFDSTVSDVTTGSRALNNSGQVAFSYLLADGRSGIAVATPDDMVVPPPPELRIDAVAVFANGSVRLEATGAPGRSHLIQTTPDVRQPWASIGSTTADVNGAFRFTDTTAGSHARRFYRAILP